ncbi:MAG TPA: hypothetical protein V6C81_28140 [Planktothrix sp.]|jgi:predicted NodU family carbamoyl transferase
MAEDLTPWLNRVKSASSRKDVFEILDQFRQSDWTDEQRSTMGKLYIRILEKLGNTPEPDEEKVAAGAAAGEEDGPVWYEKM